MHAICKYIHIFRALETIFTALRCHFREQFFLSNWFVDARWNMTHSASLTIGNTGIMREKVVAFHVYIFPGLTRSIIIFISWKSILLVTFFTCMTTTARETILLAPNYVRLRRCIINVRQFAAPVRLYLCVHE